MKTNMTNISLTTLILAATLALAPTESRSQVAVLAAPGLPAPPDSPPPPPPPGSDESSVEQIIVRATRQAADEAKKAQAAQMKVQADIARLKGDAFRWGGSKGSRVLIVPAEQPQPETISDLEEDLTVMGRVLEKA